MRLLIKYRIRNGLENYQTHMVKVYKAGYEMDEDEELLNTDLVGFIDFVQWGGNIDILRQASEQVINLVSYKDWISHRVTLH